MLNNDVPLIIFMSVSLSGEPFVQNAMFTLNSIFLDPVSQGIYFRCGKGGITHNVRGLANCHILRFVCPNYLLSLFRSNI
jgi:hypothetical protein